MTAPEGTPMNSTPTRLRVALDIGGVISKYPDTLRAMARCLLLGGAEVHVITDMQPRETVLETLRDNGFSFIAPEHVHLADYTTHGEGCKAVLLASLKIDVILDDNLGYIAVGGAPVRCLVMPDASRPYYHETWTTSGEADFGRRTFGDPADTLAPIHVAALAPIHVAAPSRDELRLMLRDAIAEQARVRGTPSEAVAALWTAAVRSSLDALHKTSPWRDQPADLDFDALEAVAQPATPGKRRWGDWSTDFGTCESGNMLDLEINLTHPGPERYVRTHGSQCVRVLKCEEPLESPADAAFLATFDRETVLALLALARRAAHAEMALRLLEAPAQPSPLELPLTSEARIGSPQPVTVALTRLLWRSIADNAVCTCFLDDPCPECQAMAALGLGRWTGAEAATQALEPVAAGAVARMPPRAAMSSRVGRRADVNRVARLLIAEWERVEGKPVNVSYIATFVDMARAVLGDRPPLDPVHIEVLRGMLAEARGLLSDRAEMLEEARAKDAPPARLERLRGFVATWTGRVAALTAVIEADLAAAPEGA
jgi:hypothetical protein